VVVGNADKFRSITKKEFVTMETQLLHDLVAAYLEAISTRAGARNPENFYQDIFREIWKIRWGTPTQQGEMAIKYVKADLGRWNNPVWIRDVQPTPAHQQEAVAMLLNLGRAMLEPKDRRAIAINILGLKHCKVVTWRSHDGGKTGYEVDLIRPFAQYQLEKLGLI
jgi:hypothetical protein